MVDGLEVADFPRLPSALDGSMPLELVPRSLWHLGGAGLLTLSPTLALGPPFLPRNRLPWLLPLFETRAMGAFHPFFPSVRSVFPFVTYVFRSLARLVNLLYLEFGTNSVSLPFRVVSFVLECFRSQLFIL